jgi:actin-related protein
MLIDDTTTELVSKVKIVAHEQGVDGTWLGGSVITSCARMLEALITHELYDEHGPKPHPLFVVFVRS